MKFIFYHASSLAPSSSLLKLPIFPCSWRNSSSFLLVDIEQLQFFEKQNEKVSKYSIKQLIMLYTCRKCEEIPWKVQVHSYHSVRRLLKTLCFALFKAVKINMTSISMHLNLRRIQLSKQSSRRNRCFLAENKVESSFNLQVTGIVQSNLYNLVCFKSNLQQLTKTVSP